jgi:hypothetical protein
MNIPELALAVLVALLFIGIILAIKEYIALRRVLSQPPESDMQEEVPVPKTQGYFLYAANTGRWYRIEDLKEEDITKKNLEELLGL